MVENLWVWLVQTPKPSLLDPNLPVKTPYICIDFCHLYIIFTHFAILYSH